MKTLHLVVVCSHPIQYYAPYYRALEKEQGIKVTVIFGARIGLDKTYDPGMGVDVSWKTDLLAGYEHVFLPESENIKSHTFRTMNNPSVSKQLSELKPDVVLLHGYASMTMLRALFWCRWNKVPAMMISDRSLLGIEDSRTSFRRKLTLKPILAMFSAFLSIGDANAEYLKTFGAPAKKIFRVPNMVDEAFWEFRTNRKKLKRNYRKQLDLEEEDFIVLFVGKLIKRKCPNDLIFALQKIKSKHSVIADKIKVLFVGDGEMRASLEESAKGLEEVAIFAGFINIDELPGYYAAADVLAHPAEAESFGIIVLEAAIMGMPLILSRNVGALGPTSIARDKQNALVHEVGDTDQITSYIKTLYENRGLLETMSNESLILSKDHHGKISATNTVQAVKFCVGEGL